MFIRWISFCLLLAGAAIQTAKADSVEDFYRGKTISMVVSSSAGGGYDTLSRAVARYLGKHIPGNPSVVVRNMPGAGGILATNFIANVAPHDGLTIAGVQPTRLSSRCSAPRKPLTTRRNSLGSARPRSRPAC